MITRLAESIALFFVQNNIVGKEDTEVYAYGVELLLSAVCNITVAILLAAISKEFFSTVVFLLVFMLFRQNVGGFHANTHLGCNSILAVVLIIFHIICKFITPSSMQLFCFISIILSDIMIFFHAPVEHPNKPISKKQNAKLRIRSRILVCAFTLAVLFLIIMDSYKTAFWISYAVIVVAISMEIEYIVRFIKERS